MGYRDPFGNQYRIRGPEDFVSDSNKLTQFLSSSIKDKRITKDQLRAEAAVIQNDFKDE